MAKADSWQPLVDELSDVGKLVHLAYRSDSVTRDQLAAELLRARRSAYEQELTHQAARVGCPGQHGQLGEGPVLSALRDASRRDADSIVGTYNYDLATQITAIRSDAPRANRYVYRKRLNDWDARRAQWKVPQIQQQAVGDARAQAQVDFKRNNAVSGYAVLRPKAAVCPVCQGWVRRGKVPLDVAMNSPGPYHPGCVPPGEWVLMRDGMKKPIEDVQVGEDVMVDGSSCLVKRVFLRQTQEPVYHLSVGGRSLRLTGEHPVKTKRGWIAARDLRVGDLIMTVDDRGCHSGGK